MQLFFSLKLCASIGMCSALMYIGIKCINNLHYPAIKKRQDQRLKKTIYGIAVIGQIKTQNRWEQSTRHKWHFYFPLFICGDTQTQLVNYQMKVYETFTGMRCDW
jgi:hypothetical protein